MGLDIVLAAAVMFVLAMIMAGILGWANKAFHVEVDPRVDEINDALPGANCGGCGYVGFNEYAEALVAKLGEVAVTLCPVGGEACATALASILGLEMEETFPYRPVVHCVACQDDKLGRHEYFGEPTCSAANLVAGVQGCTYGCLAMGDCVSSCDYDAIHVIDGQIVVDYDKCIGCSACARVCPRKVISMVPFKNSQMFVIGCSNMDFGKDVKAVCKSGCLGCKACTKIGKGLFSMSGNIPTIDYDAYHPGEVADTMRDVIGKCPAKKIVEVGNPSAKDLADVADEQLPEVIRADFETTVDQTEWQG